MLDGFEGVGRVLEYNCHVAIWLYYTTEPKFLFTASTSQKIVTELQIAALFNQGAYKNGIEMEIGRRGTTKTREALLQWFL